MYEERSSLSHLIEYVWMASIDITGGYTHPANEHWGLTFLNDHGVYEARLQGPATQPTKYSYREGQEYWGVALKTHVFLKSIQKRDILNNIIDLPVKDTTFTLAGGIFTIQPYEKVELLVDEMEQKGILLADSHIAEALSLDTKLSKRSLQRHFSSTAGLSEQTIQQIARARRAYYLLEQGTAINDVVHEMNYADQAHLTRSLKILAGQTPAKILSEYTRQKG